MGLSTVDLFKRIPITEGMVEVDDAMLRQLQTVLRDMLIAFARACSHLGITYMLGGGSCLGAIRHHGFIPWDDDIDLNMARNDFITLADHFEELLGNNYSLQIPGQTDGYELAFARIRKHGTTLRSREDFDAGECGVYIDIFFVDNVPNGKIARMMHGAISMALGLAVSCSRFHAHRSDYMKLAGSDQMIRSTFLKKARIGRMLSFYSPVRWAALWDRWNGLCKDAHSIYVSIPVGRRHYFGELYRRVDYFPVSYGSFEGVRVPLPANPDNYMKALYGADYMTPPSADARERHVVLEFDLGNAPTKGCIGESEAE